MTTLLNKLSRRKELFVLVMMLEMLHLSIWFDFGSLISRSFMLSHLGLFLLWQPVWRGDEKLSIENTILFIVFTLALTLWLNLWLLFAWLILLIGFLSGRITQDRNERIIYIFALAFLAAELFLACIPELANVTTVYQHILSSSLTFVPLFLLVFPHTLSTHQVHKVDFIHAITTSMLTSLVALGILLNMFLSETTYFAALTQTSIAIGGFIICISWLLTSQSRFSNITQLWSSYMLNIGTPFEAWLSELELITELSLSPSEFLREALQKMAEFSWISGVTWKLDSTIYNIGIKTSNEIETDVIDFKICIYTYNPAGAALRLHSNLLIKLLHNFYLNKQREKELTKQAHLKAIYETGARITHDIKNLLQSLQAITSIVTHDSGNSNVLVTQQVLKKQLPNLTQRLQLALDKLQTPQHQDMEEIYLKDWWSDLQKRNAHHTILFQADLHGDPTIPVDLFDSVVDNLLENIQSKQINEPEIEITITLVSNENITSVTVCDSGSMIPDDISRDLLSSVIASDNGLGIGLYQANKHAEIFGYDLKLTNNHPGRVCFELKSKQENKI